MAINPDFKDLLSALSAAQARSDKRSQCAALMFFTTPRYTKALDIWIDMASADPAHDLEREGIDFDQNIVAHNDQIRAGPLRDLARPRGSAQEGRVDALHVGVGQA
jgi:hypothetical protein